MRKVEVFSAGCLMCDDVVKVVEKLACPDCQVEVHDLRTQKGLRAAGECGIARVPTVVVDGRVAPCCAQGSPDAGQLRALGVGIRLS